MAEEKYKVGDRFNSWTLLKKLPKKNTSAMWRVICDCGAIRETYAGNITLGRSKSCGPCSAKAREENYRKFGNHPLSKKGDQ